MGSRQLESVINKMTGVATKMVSLKLKLSPHHQTET